SIAPRCCTSNQTLSFRTPRTQSYFERFSIRVVSDTCCLSRLSQLQFWPSSRHGLLERWILVLMYVLELSSWALLWRHLLNWPCKKFFRKSGCTNGKSNAFSIFAFSMKLIVQFNGDLSGSIYVSRANVSLKEN